MGGNFVNQQKENCMKNNIFKIIIFFLALVSLGACDDGCEDYLDQYESILYFKNNGEQHVTIYGEFYQFNLSSCIRQQNSLTAQFVSFSLSNLANIFYPPPIFTIINLCLL